MPRIESQPQTLTDPPNRIQSIEKNSPINYPLAIAEIMKSFRVIPENSDFLSFEEIVEANCCLLDTLAGWEIAGGNLKALLETEIANNGHGPASFGTVIDEYRLNLIRRQTIEEFIKILSPNEDSLATAINKLGLGGVEILEAQQQRKILESLDETNPQLIFTLASLETALDLWQSLNLTTKTEADLIEDNPNQQRTNQLALLAQKGLAAKKLVEESTHPDGSLYQAIEEGDEALSQLLEENRNLIKSIAYKYYDSKTPFDDLLQEGRIGFIKAVARFDPQKGKLSTYAYPWILRTIQLAVIQDYSSVHYPVYLLDKARSATAAISRLSHQLGREPTDAELAAELKTTVKMVSKIRRSLTSERSLDWMIENETERDLQPDGAVFKNPTQEAAFKHIIIGEINAVLEKLPPQQRIIMQYFLGLNPYHPGVVLTLEEIGKKLGLTRSRVHQLKKAALAEIEQSSEGKRLLSMIG